MQSRLVWPWKVNPEPGRTRTELPLAEGWLATGRSSPLASELSFLLAKDSYVAPPYAFLTSPGKSGGSELVQEVTGRQV